MAVTEGLQHLSSQLMAEPLWIKVSCIWSCSLTWHSVFVFFLFLGSTGNTRRHVSGQTMRNIRNARPLEGSRVIFVCLARVSNLYSLTSSSFFQSCHFQLKSYLVKQKSHKKVEKANSMRKRGGNKRIFKVVMFDLEKMPTNPL